MPSTDNYPAGLIYREPFLKIPFFRSSVLPFFRSSVLPFFRPSVLPSFGGTTSGLLPDLFQFHQCVRRSGQKNRSLQINSCEEVRDFDFFPLHVFHASSCCVMAVDRHVTVRVRCLVKLEQFVRRLGLKSYK